MVKGSWERKKKEEVGWKGMNGKKCILSWLSCGVVLVVVVEDR